MYFRKIFISLIIASTCVGFVSCSDDDDNPSGNNGSNNINEVFPNGLLSSIKEESSYSGTEQIVCNMVRDKSGRVTSIKYRDVYQYKIDYISSESVQVTIYDVEEESEVYTFSLGKNGYISGMNATIGGETQTMKANYDSEGHLISMVNTYSSPDDSSTSTYTITYNESGDLIKYTRKYESYYHGIKESSTETSVAEYTNSTITTPLENKGGVMLYDEIFGIDLDDEICLYYAGLLGKGTAHLPVAVKWTSISNDESYEGENFMTWTIDSKGLASSVTLVDSYETTKYTFNW